MKRKITLSNLKASLIDFAGVQINYKGFDILIYKDFNGYFVYRCDEEPRISGNHYKSLVDVKNDIREEVEEVA